MNDWRNSSNSKTSNSCTAQTFHDTVLAWPPCGRCQPDVAPPITLQRLWHHHLEPNCQLVTSTIILYLRRKSLSWSRIMFSSCQYSCFMQIAGYQIWRGWHFLRSCFVAVAVFRLVSRSRIDFTRLLKKSTSLLYLKHVAVSIFSGHSIYISSRYTMYNHYNVIHDTQCDVVNGYVETT